MLFSTELFIFAFLPLVLLGFYCLKAYKYYQGAKIFLIIASLFFYGFWKVDYIFILIFSLLVNFTLANIILKANRRGGSQL